MNLFVLVRVSRVVKLGRKSTKGVGIKTLLSVCEFQELTHEFSNEDTGPEFLVKR